MQSNGENTKNDLEENINLKLRELISKKKIMTKPQGTKKASEALNKKQNRQISDLKLENEKLRSEISELKKLICINNTKKNETNTHMECETAKESTDKPTEDPTRRKIPRASTSNDDVENNDDFDDFVQVLSQKNAAKKVKNNNKMDNNQINNAASTANVDTKKNTLEKSKKNRMPPISVYMSDTNCIKKTLTLSLKIKDFLIKEISSNHLIIYTFDINDYKKVCELLKKTETNYYTFTPKIEKKTTLILKGLSAEYDPTEVMEILKEHQTEKTKIEKVERLQTKRTIKENKTLPIYVVQLSPGAIHNEIFAIKALDHQMVRWENIKKRDITQCTRCQRFGHSASNCNMEFRCVKCGKSHQPGQCEIKTDDPRESLFCILCGKNGHPASYRNCPIFKKREELKNKIKQQQKEKILARQNMYNNYINPQISYSNLVRNNNNIKSNNTNNNNNYSNINNNNNNIDSNTNILIEIRNSISIIKDKINENAQRIDYLFELVCATPSHQ